MRVVRLVQKPVFNKVGESIEVIVKIFSVCLRAPTEYSNASSPVRVICTIKVGQVPSRFYLAGVTFLLKLKVQQTAASAHSIPHSSLEEAVLVTFALMFILTPTCHMYLAASITDHAKARMMTARCASISPCRCKDCALGLATCRSTDVSLCLARCR